MNTDKILNFLEIHLRNPRSLAPFHASAKNKKAAAPSRGGLKLESRTLIGRSGTSATTTSAASPTSASATAAKASEADEQLVVSHARSSGNLGLLIIRD